MSGSGAPTKPTPGRLRLALAGIGVLALVLRLLGFERVFVGDAVVFVIGDPWYHLRLARYAFGHFPSFLTWDPYLNHPHGAFVPWPPGFDLLLAGAARLLGASEHGLEELAALAPPVLAGLTVAPIFALARMIGGRALALGAATLFAVFPASVVFSRVGYADHHVLVALLGATLLALQARAFLASPGSPRRGAALAAGMAVARGALVASWQGSLAYLAIADVSLVLVAAALGERRVLAIEAASLLLSAALVAPFAPASLRSIGGPFSAIELSWLHVAACAAIALWSLACRAWAASARTVFARGVRAVALGAFAAAGLVAVPGVISGHVRAAAFLGKADLWGGGNPEQQPLFYLSEGKTWAEVLFGYLGYLVPVLPVYLAARAWRARDTPQLAPCLLLACWSGSFGGLAVLQMRFANDLTPAASVGFASLLAGLGGLLARRLRLGGHVRALPAVALGVALVALPLAREHGPHLRKTLAFLRGADAGADRALLTPAGTLMRFAEIVLASTPETSGFDDADGSPEYGILADPSLGHVLHQAAHRATPSDNFGPYVAPGGFLETLGVLLVLPEEVALAVLRRLEVRYVVTNWRPAYPPSSLLRQLQEFHGLESDGRRALSRFRLVAEGPEGGFSVGSILVPTLSGAVPYKLFEVVEGAVLEVHGEPGARATASAMIFIAGGHRFTYRARAVGDASGVARIRVPYPTEATDPGRAEGPYRVESGGELGCARVSEGDVREGRVVRVSPSPCAGPTRAGSPVESRPRGSLVTSAPRHSGPSGSSCGAIRSRALSRRRSRSARRGASRADACRSFRSR